MSEKKSQLSPDFLSKISQNFPLAFFTQERDQLNTYGKDWTSVYLPNPSGIAFPKTTEEVASFLKICSAHRIAVVPSGGRTGLAAGAVASNGEVVLSLHRMNQMHPVDTLANTVRVQAGAVTEAVHQHCLPLGLTWPVDFASKGSSQVGGNISTNAGGVKVIRYGLTRNWVLGLQVVTMQGQILELNGALEKNNTGIDLRQLFIGSEGILGVVTEATLKLTQAAPQTDVFFFGLNSVTAVLNLFKEVRKAPFQIMAFEFLSDNCLQSVATSRKIQPPFAESCAEYVLLEIERPTHPGAQTIMDSWLESLFDQNLVQNGTLAQSPREAVELWSLREGITESLGMRGFVHKNDISLPISNLEKFITDMHQMFKTAHNGIEVFLFGHIGDGNLHVSTLKPAGMDRTKFTERCHQADIDLFTLVQKHSGSISAEHGIGLLKKDSLKFTRKPEEIKFMQEMKKIFDPEGLLNPGKIFDHSAKA
jgi:FAD/FMN-containing dehydrogenase